MNYELKSSAPYHRESEIWKANPQEKMWMCVLIKDGKVKERFTTTLTTTRRHSYYLLEKQTEFTYTQIRRMGWKAVKVTLGYHIHKNPIVQHT